jgi:hypothetical protein
MGLSEQGRQRIQDLGTLKLRSIDARPNTAIRNRLEALNSRLGRDQSTPETKIDNHRARRIAAPDRMENYNQVLEGQARFESKLQSVA